MTLDDRITATERRVTALERRVGEPGRWLADAPTRSKGTYADATRWANRYTLGELSMSEADAWRAGRDACVHAVRAIAARLRARADNDQQCLACVSTLDIAADQLAQMEPRAEETGLCERGA
jgi:hypothetical protein